MLLDTLMAQFSQMGDDEAELAGVLSQAVRFQIDNVATYFHEVHPHLPGEKLSPFRLEDHIPNIAPLAPLMWFEYNGSSVGESPFFKAGCSVSVVYERGYFHEQNVVHALPENVRWVLIAEHYTYREQQGTWEIGASDWIYTILVDDHGSFLGVQAFVNEQFGLTESPPRAEKRDVWHETIVISLLAVCFAHCKGAKVEEHHSSRQVRRAAERTGKPIYTFRTIDIHPSTTALHAEGRVSENGLARALHICRGHFAHYTADKPLFGQYTGTFYRPLHIRGSIEKGIVSKDYRVHAEN